MARVFTSGFEEGTSSITSTSFWHLAAGASVTIVATAPHSGGSHMRQPAGSSGCAGPRTDLNSAKTSGTYFYRVYWRAATLPTSGTTIRILSVKSAGSADAFSVRYNRSTGCIQLVQSVTPETIDGTATISAGVWYRIEARLLISDTVGECQAKLFEGDSTTALDDLSAAVGDTLPTSIQQFYIGADTSVNNGQVWFLDDVAINDATGSTHNSWCGPEKIALLTPDADTTVTWTKAGSSPAATNFGGVSEVPSGLPDDATTYNEDAGTTNVDRLGLSDLPAEVPADATIHLVDVRARCSAGAASQTAVLRIWDEGGATTDGPSIALGNGTWATTSSAEHLAVDCTVAGKTKANVNAFSVGYKGNTGASAKRVGTIWVNVGWLEASGGPDQPYPVTHQVQMTA